MSDSELLSLCFPSLARTSASPLDKWQEGICEEGSQVRSDFQLTRNKLKYSEKLALEVGTR